jgi:flagellar biosynthesis protein FlhF
MKMKSFAAPDMRAAMRLVRTELGPDAVILSTDRNADGLTVTAAVDFEPAAPPMGAVDSLAIKARGPEAVCPPHSAVSEELRSLREMLETQVAQIAWNEYARRSPTAGEVRKELSSLGFEPTLLNRIVTELPPGIDIVSARRICLLRIADLMNVSGDRWIQYGGRFALLGAGGSGKSSACVRLAARWTLRHGRESIALISADNIRIAASEQLAAHARLLGVASYEAQQLSDLPELLARLAGYRCVLIDTAGLDLKRGLDEKLWQEIVQQVPELEYVIVAAATARPRQLTQVCSTLSALRPQSVLLTKLDEAERLAELLSVVVNHNLTLSYATTGRRLLEDLRPARALELVTAAVEQGRELPQPVTEIELGRTLATGRGV